MDQKSVNPYYGRGWHRVISGVFGLFLAGVGIYVVFFGVVDPLSRVAAGSLIALFGGNAIWSAIHSKESWLAKLGPLF